MKIVYQGPNDAVMVHAGDGAYIGATRGKPVDLPAALANELVANGEWKKSDPGAEKETA